MSGQELYEAMVRYAISKGLRREEPGSGWWCGEGLRDEDLLPGAIETLMANEGIDFLEPVPGEPEDYWG